MLKSASRRNTPVGRSFSLGRLRPGSGRPFVVRSVVRSIKRMLIRSILLALVFGAAAAAPLAQPVPIEWSASTDPAVAASPGDLVTVRVRGTIEPGWRLYAMDSQAGRPLVVRLDAPASLRPLGGPQQAQPREGYDRYFQSDYTYFEEEVTVTQAFRLSGDAEDGAHRLEAAVTFMLCNDDVCLPPRTQEVATVVRVDASGRSASAAEAPAGPDATARAVAPDAPQADGEAPVAMQDEAPLAEGRGEETSPAPDPAEAGPEPPPASDAASVGMLAFILLAIGAGFAALLTPCVFPMIPLTVSFFLHHASDRARAARMAAVYGLSIVTIFTGLGLAMAALVGAAGPMLIATNPWINLFLGAVLVVFGFSLLGFFEIRLPGAWANYFNRKGAERSGYAGAVFMGLTLTLVSFSCTVPFVGALLAQAVRAEWTYPIVGMLVFSTVFALPFVAFALFPGALQRMPRSGSWMTALKGVLGFIVIAAAIKFISNADVAWGLGILPRPLAVSLMIVIFALTGLLLLGRLALRTPGVESTSAGPEPVGPFRLAAAIASFGLSLYLLPGLFGAQLGGIDAFLPPPQAGGAGQFANYQSTTQPDAFWHHDREQAFAEARRLGLPVLVDFTGHACANCRYMEANVLSRPAVAERIRKGFVPLKLWSDDRRDGPAVQEYQFDLTGLIVLPTYAIVSPAGDLLGQKNGISSLSAFTEFLDRYAPAGSPLAAR
jgi:thiol:disulfide interchange protein